MSLFAKMEQDALQSAQPLAARMRPQNLDDFVGQQHILGPDGLLRRLIQSDRLGSIILYGPPGTGKTTLARLLATATNRQFREISAVLHGVKELRTALDEARNELASGGTATLLFIDEIHRFNKTQQDAVMADVEQGIVSLVGATTSNPFFAINAALVSRSQVFQFEPLSIEDIVSLLQRALNDSARGLGDVEVLASPAALNSIAKICDGDARKALGILEVAVLSNPPPVELTPELLANSVTQKSLIQNEDTHYDTASALIKSIRGSDPDAGIYWLARMLESGEDVRFLCRRLVILASEDIGNADPQALSLAVACMQACEFIGLPECQLTLAQTVTYLACAPKSNAATVAINTASKDIREGRVLPIPPSLKDSHYAAAKSKLGHGADYQYSHDAEGGVVAQDYLGVERTYYEPVDRGFEKVLAERLREIRRILHRGKAENEQA
ncbi:MAG: replication-associated recombination protein A [Planctomycetaceae bacterium]|nr:replication-associated recombination protein A [Planctomycetaceae bacterium]MCP4463835.1 replication-associated recombination protein A [Planctomycetaceae bacterium]MDG1807375.1 replication-associated recombination protein A [Pirellulaceae bacterium]MDG2102316.1 replication-associated recombination protein A [Pirellulaceae bacterium]